MTVALLRSRQGEAAFRQELREPFAGEKRVFLLAHGGEVVEALEFRVDESGVTHHHAPLGQAFQERCEHFVISGGAAEIIDRVPTRRSRGRRGDVT